MSTQYDQIGTRYLSMEELPAVDLYVPVIDRIVGDVSGLRCLDLASGMGKWSTFLAKKGAASVVGVDISQAMIAGAQNEQSKLPDDLASRIEYRLDDLSKPIAVQGAPFDVVIAVYLLNYAATPDELLTMFKNVHNNLKPGGIFVAVVPNAFKEWQAIDGYGIHMYRIGTTEDGWRIQFEADTVPEKVRFQTYGRLHDKFEEAAAKIGMGSVQWHEHVFPDDERNDQGFWDHFKKTPHFQVFSCHRAD